MSNQEKLFGDSEEVKVRKNIPLEEAKKFVTKTLKEMDFDIDFETITLVGSMRRKKETVNDIDFVMIASDKGWLQLRNYFLGKLKAKRVCAGEKILRFILNGFELDFYRATEDNFGIHQLIRTGSAEHNVYLARLAISKRMRIKYSLGIIKGTKVIAGRSESSIFTALGLNFIEPEDREIVDGKPIWKKK